MAPGCECLDEVHCAAEVANVSPLLGYVTSLVAAPSISGASVVCPLE